MILIRQNIFKTFITLAEKYKKLPEQIPRPYVGLWRGRGGLGHAWLCRGAWPSPPCINTIKMFLLFLRC